MENLNIGLEIANALSKHKTDIENYIVENDFGDSLVEALIKNAVCRTMIQEFATLKSVNDTILSNVGASFEAGINLGYYIGKYLEAQNAKS